MPKARNPLKNLKIETAAGTRKCHANSKHTIAAGEKHLAQYDDSGMVRENICAECAPRVLAQIELHLSELRAHF
ncbi:hypothetical protein [Achromobacter insuavis]|uniref:hypothetical protein n=1 Tax=Achromobacter insuavis TaxID=1287735 RepID=UPI001EEABD60|nr:hypothetical protein [Achromobacter insuavis]